MKATEQYFLVVLFIMLYKVGLTFESVNEILQCDYLEERWWQAQFCGAICDAIQGVSYLTNLQAIKWRFFQFFSLQICVSVFRHHIMNIREYLML